MLTHKDLDVWKLSIELVVKVYKFTNQLPEEEKYGIINQMKRSSVSIPSNIAEGAARTSAKDLQILFLFHLVQYQSLKHN